MIVKNFRIYVILMGYWIVVQVRTMVRSVMCKSTLRMGENILSRVLMMPCAVFLRSYLKGARSIDLLCSGRNRVDGIMDAL